MVQDFVYPQYASVAAFLWFGKVGVVGSTTKRATLQHHESKTVYQGSLKDLHFATI